MQLYKVKDDYIIYLREKEPKVLKNKEEKRPYLGVLYKVNGFDYYIPLSSPKPKHKTMKNTKDFHKIAGGAYGAINFNKIIPIKQECLIEFKFKDEESEDYRLLLQNQYKVLLTMKNLIENKTNNIYKLFHTDNNNLTKADIKVKERCCNFDLLEELCELYEEQLEVAITGENNK